MKRSLTLMSMLITIFSLNFDFRAATITAITDGGLWNSALSWDLGRAPSCGDTIIVPAGIDITVFTNVNLDNGDATCSAVRLNIAGSLRFFNGKKMKLAAGACVSVEDGGQIRQSIVGGGASESISIDGVKVWQASDGMLTGPSTMGCPVLLPVNLISFLIQKQEKSLMITWSVSDEKNLVSYEILSSTNGFNWNSIHIEQVQSNFEITKSYAFRYHLLNHENIYFKLMSHDINGKKTVLSIQTIEQNLSSSISENDFLIFPNPVSNSALLNIAFDLNSNEVVQVILIDQAGKLVYNEEIVAENGLNTITLESKDFEKGSYFVKIISNSDFKTQKLIL